MAHAIGCIGSGMDLRTKPRAPMTDAQRERNNRLVPRKVRNQTRKIGFVLIKREDGTAKVRAVRAGHAHHVQAAYLFADVEIVKREDGKPLVVKASELNKTTARRIVRRPQ